MACRYVARVAPDVVPGEPGAPGAPGGETIAAALAVFGDAEKPEEATFQIGMQAEVFG